MKKLEEASLAQEISAKHWEEKERQYMQIIDKLKGKEVDDWSNTYQSLLDKVEHLKWDIDNSMFD